MELLGKFDQIVRYIAARMTRIDSNQYLQAYNLKLVHVFGGNIEYLFAKYHERVYIVDDDNGKVVKY
jgi:hypothetical protein